MKFYRVVSCLVDSASPHLGLIVADPTERDWGTTEHEFQELTRTETILLLLSPHTVGAFGVIEDEEGMPL